jgi:hypothetical protein
MDLSEALNFSVKKIVEQGSQCRTTNGCAYGLGSKRCAIGWLLDDTNPELMSHGGDVGEIIDHFQGEIPSIIRNHDWIFSVLQVFHDEQEKEGRENSLNKLRAVAPSVDYSGDHWEAWVNMGV